MNRAVFALALIALCALLPACSDMHDQPSIKAQEAPRRSAPGEAVPVRGKVAVDWQGQYVSSEPDVASSRQRGEELYLTNCAMCHGTRDTYLGAVGKALTPPPPSLHDPRIRSLSDGDLFKRISLGFGRMPAFERLIPVHDRWHLINYLHSFR
ncbi:MAG: cytochrome c [Desulfuromonadales bacterium]|nr:cytochrome c [Desulfuromonadales bacterium]